LLATVHHDVSLATIARSQEVDIVEVLCTVKLEDNLDDIGLNQLCQWFSELDVKFKIKVECLYNAHSSRMILKMPPYIWSRLDGTEGLAFVSFVRGPCRLAEFIARFVVNPAFKWEP
jgi:hypothetical protein